MWYVCVMNTNNNRPKMPRIGSVRGSEVLPGLDLDQRIRIIALYDVTHGNTRVVAEMDVFRRCVMFKAQLQSGEWGYSMNNCDGTYDQLEPIDRLERFVMQNFAGTYRPWNSNELEVERVLAAAGLTEERK